MLILMYSYSNNSIVERKVLHILHAKKFISYSFANK